MNNGELIEQCLKYPKEAEIYAVSDHGQVEEKAGGISVSKDEKLPFSNNEGEISWKCEEEVQMKKHVTAILIGQ
jgi:hypothetical protein